MLPDRAWLCLRFRLCGAAPRHEAVVVAAGHPWLRGAIALFVLGSRAFGRQQLTWRWPANHEPGPLGLAARSWANSIYQYRALGR